MKSVASMIEQVAGMLGTDDLTEWESSFVESIVDRIGERKDTTRLSPKQAEIAERIWRKHFAG